MGDDSEIREDTLENEESEEAPIQPPSDYADVSTTSESPSPYQFKFIASSLYKSEFPNWGGVRPPL
jgi:hypothetical protein